MVKSNNYFYTELIEAIEMLLIIKQKIKVLNKEQLFYILLFTYFTYIFLGILSFYLFNYKIRPVYGTLFNYYFDLIAPSVLWFIACCIVFRIYKVSHDFTRWLWLFKFIFMIILSPIALFMFFPLGALFERLINTSYHEWFNIPYV